MLIKQPKGSATFTKYRWYFRAFAGIAVIGSCGILYYRYSLNRQLSEHDIIQKCVNGLLSHKGLCQHFGEPVIVQAPNISDSKNEFLGKEAHLNGPITGRLKKGTYFMHAKNPQDSAESWVIQKLEVQDNDVKDKRILMVDLDKNIDHISGNVLKKN